jgi:hypothetical protein
MSAERELLESCLDEMQYHETPCPELVIKIKELLAQPKQEPMIGMYRDIFDDYKYILTAFKNGADANDYSREIHQAESDIRKACNWLYPLPTDAIDDLILKSFYAGTFDFRVFARGLEKQHGIGEGGE